MVWASARAVGEQTNFPPSLIRNFSREVSLLVAQPEAFFHSQDLITVPACIGVASNFQLGDEQEKYTVPVEGTAGLPIFNALRRRPLPWP